MQIKEQRNLSDLQKAIPTLKNLPQPLSMSLSVKSQHERDVKRARYVVQRIEAILTISEVFENELTKQIEPTEQEMLQMREEIEEAKKRKARAYRRAYYKEY